MISVQCEKCGKYTEDVKESGDYYIFDPQGKCPTNDGGNFVEFVDGKNQNTGAVSMSHVLKDKADLGGVTPKKLS